MRSGSEPALELVELCQIEFDDDLFGSDIRCMHTIEGTTVTRADGERFGCSLDLMVDQVRSPAMWFCDECGRRAEGGDPPAADPPICEEHGPRWRLVRNATCAEVLVERDGQVLLGRRGREPFAGMWEIPGGFVDRGEHPVDTAVRELREELGITVELTALLGTYLEQSAYGECLEITCYLGRTEDPEPVPDPVEVSEWGWFGPADLPDVMAGRDRERLDDWKAGRAVPLPADGR